MVRQMGFGGSCHWCMEAVFQSLRGVCNVQQGWIAPADNIADFSEAVLVDFDDHLIPVQILTEIHMATHSSTANHSRRNKYRSAIYVMNDEQHEKIKLILGELQKENNNQIITEPIRFGNFSINTENYLNYYQKDPEKPFCKTWIEPKLALVLNKYAQYAITTQR